MKLTQEEKEDLKQITNMRGWKVLEKINDEANTMLFRNLSSLDLDDQKNIDNIKLWQTYWQARRDFFRDTEAHLREVYNNKIAWVDY